MKAECQDCGHRFETRKDVSERDSPLRCSECGSRSVEPQETSPDGGDDHSPTSEAFRRFKQGDTPLDLVEADICGPDKARKLRREFNDLAEGEYVLLTEEELEERLTTERRNIRERMEQEKNQIRNQAKQRIDELESQNQALRQQLSMLEAGLENEFEMGWNEGRKEGYEEAREEFGATVEEIAAQKREKISRVEEAFAELNDTVNEEMVTEEECEKRIRSVKEEFEAMEDSIYSEGFRYGVFVGAKHVAQEGVTQPIIL